MPSETYKYKKGQELMIDDIYDIQALAGGDMFLEASEEWFDIEDGDV